MAYENGHKLLHCFNASITSSKLSQGQFHCVQRVLLAEVPSRDDFLREPVVFKSLQWDASRWPY